MTEEDAELTAAGFKGSYGEVIRSKYGTLQVIDAVILDDVSYIIAQNRYGTMRALSPAEANSSRLDPPKTTW